MTKRKLMLILIVGGGLVSACNGDGDTSVSDTARYQINTSTCNSNTAHDINNTQYSENNTEIDVNSLTPNCNLQGG